MPSGTSQGVRNPGNSFSLVGRALAAKLRAPGNRYVRQKPHARHILAVCDGTYILGSKIRGPESPFLGELHMRRFFLLTLTAAALGASSSSAGEKNPVVVMETSMGKIRIELFKDKAPITVKNFLDYVDEKHYDNTIFHRVISNFMIQGGGFTPGMKEKKTKDPIKNESLDRKSTRLNSSHIP